MNYLFGSCLVIEPFLPLIRFIDPGLQNWRVILRDTLPPYDMYCHRYVGYPITKLSDFIKEKPVFNKSDLVLTTMHVEEPPWQKVLDKVAKGLSTWIHIQHDYMETFLTHRRDVTGMLLLNNPQMVKAPKGIPCMYINPHKYMEEVESHIHDLDHKSLYKEITGKELCEADKEKNVYFNMTYALSDTTYKSLCNNADFLHKKGYNIFIKNYGMGIPGPILNWKKGKENIYFTYKTNSPTGAMVMHKWCSVTLGVFSSSLIEGLYYDSLPLGFKDIERTLITPYSNHFNKYVSWYVMQAFMPAPITCFEQGKSLLEQPEERKKVVKFLKDWWLTDNDSSPKNHINDIVDFVNGLR